MQITIADPTILRAISNSGLVVSAELYKAAPNGHKFCVGETRTLVGLEDFPEYNGETVAITAIREDGAHGKAYYVSGRINEVINWVYEYRLK